MANHEHDQFEHDLFDAECMRHIMNTVRNQPTTPDVVLLRRIVATAYAGETSVHTLDVSAAARVCRAHQLHTHDQGKLVCWAVPCDRL